MSHGEYNKVNEIHFQMLTFCFSLLRHQHCRPVAEQAQVKQRNYLKIKKDASSVISVLAAMKHTIAPLFRT